MFINKLKKNIYFEVLTVSFVRTLVIHKNLKNSINENQQNFKESNKLKSFKHDDMRLKDRKNM